MIKFKEYLSEFAGNVSNQNSNFDIGYDVSFIYNNEIITGMITETEGGKHGKAILMFDTDLISDKNKEVFNRNIIVHASKFRLYPGTKRLKTIKKEEIKYV